MNTTRVGVDLAKQGFQIHGIGRDGKTLVRRQLRRSQMMSYFSKLSPTLIGMEAGGSAHYLGERVARDGE